MRIRPIMFIAATATAAAIATAGGMATAATGTPTPTATPAPVAHGKPSGAPAATAGSSVVSGSGSAAAPAPATPAAFTVTSTATTPIDAGTTAEILASCLGSEASQFHPVIAVRAPVASSDTDGVVLAVNSAKQYVQCESKGNKGTSMSSPATFINDRLWGVGHRVSFFDSFSAPAGAGQFLSLDAGHYTPDVAKITISYGDNPTQYPAVMAGGAFVHTAAISTGHNEKASPPVSYVHAYNADGKEIYNQKTQPNIKGARQ
ncbi:hypothetical protein [Kitasatospora brasiliensis]|uniref:hypothetical protein n=1 Tax=Kitasatospora brasiliensis TaxID=3058040 RepID=UPI00292EC44B|nr:hypothetical protein [Kitasatospora sp. K002]